MRRFPGDKRFRRTRRLDAPPGEDDSPQQTPAERRREVLMMLAVFLAVAALVGGLAILDP
jgi:ferric-dicitrate binding protein FerR (iron transport regulator)